MQTILKEKLNVKQLIIGFNHHFGRPAGETADDYRQMGKALGIEVSIADEFRYNGEPVSSSAIRKALCEGELQKANDLLGHHYSLSGTVVEGRKVGRTLGFPTANIRPEAADKLLPRNGSYAVTIRHYAHCSYRTYVNREKVRMAKMYLENTELSVQEIGSQLGFADSNYFHTFYKNTSGNSLFL